MDKLEALAAMLDGKFIRFARYGGGVYWFDETVGKFCLQYDDESTRYTDINCLNNNVELAMFSEYEDAVAYGDSNANKGIYND